MITSEKQRLRSRMREVLKSLRPGEIGERSVKIRSVLKSWRPWVESESVCMFFALAAEADVLSPWPEGKKIFLPRISGDKLVIHHVEDAESLVVGPWGVREPSAQTLPAGLRADLILVPGMAFDRVGRRLGRGGGYYDRLLAEFAGLRAGVCFEEQILEAIPTEAHDATVDFLITPGGVLPCAP
jgi:5-formyltetrahydrofolate cyclo-ligase